MQAKSLKSLCLAPLCQRFFQDSLGDSQCEKSVSAHQKKIFPFLHSE